MKPNQERFANCAETFLATTKGWEILERDYEGFDFVALDKEGETVHFIKTAYRTADAVGFPDEHESLQSEERKAFENAAIKSSLTKAKTSLMALFAGQISQLSNYPIAKRYSACTQTFRWGGSDGNPYPTKTQSTQLLLDFHRRKAVGCDTPSFI